MTHVRSHASRPLRLACSLALLGAPGCAVAPEDTTDGGLLHTTERLSSACLSGDPVSGASQSFAETGQTVRGNFLDYMNATGGISGTGLPISGVFTAPSADGASHPTQCFERRVLEFHPENDCHYVVEGRLLGRERFDLLYPDHTAEYRLGFARPPAGAPIAPVWDSFEARGQTFTPRYFSETSQTAGAVFVEYWDRTGGLSENGYPISGTFEEYSEAEPGHAYWVQYFERAVFEYDPSAAYPWNVRGKLLGDFAAMCRADGRDVMPSIQPSRPRNPPGGTDTPQEECAGCVWLCHTSHDHYPCTGSHSHEVCQNWSSARNACFENPTGRVMCGC